MIIYLLPILALFAMLVSADPPNEEPSDARPFPPPDIFWPRPRPRPKPGKQPPTQPPQADCTKIKTCSDCVSKECTWSVNNIACFPCRKPNEKECKDDNSNTTFLTFLDRYKWNDNGCPGLSGGIITIPSGTKQKLNIKTYGIANRGHLTQLRYTCRITIEDKTIEVPANFIADTIQCEEIDFSYKMNTLTMTIPFDVYAGSKDYVLENVFGKIEMFKCDLIGNNCQSCLRNGNKYECGWCSKTNRCTVGTSCETGSWKHLIPKHNEEFSCNQKSNK